MNSLFVTLILLISLIIVKTIVIKAKKKTVKDERTQFIGSKAAQAAFVIYTTILALSSFFLVLFGQYGTVPAAYIYNLGIVISYLTCFNLILYIILYAYFNKES